MNRHTVFIAGKRFVLLSEEKEAYVQSLASEVSSEIERISEEIPALENKSCAVLCALNYADERNKAIQRNKSLSGSAKTVMNQADKQGKQLRELKEKLSRSEETVKALNNHNIELERSHKQLMDENDLLRATVADLTKKLEEKEKEPEKENPRQTAQEQPKGYTPQRQISLFDNE